MIKSWTLLLFLYFHSALVKATCSTSTKYYNYTIISSNNTVIFNSDGSFYGRATAAIFYYLWTVSIPGAGWIWKAGTPLAEMINFQVEFFLVGTPISATLQVAVDDNVVTTVNGNSTNCNLWSWNTMTTCDVVSILYPGANIMNFRVVNNVGPAGLMYMLTVQTKE